ncbi:MAG: hypothetical protein ACR2J7_04640 [Luteimonas sp.]
MRYRILLAFLLSQLLGGCATLVDGLARDERAHHGVFIVQPYFHNTIRSEHAGEHWRRIRFCESYALGGAYPLHVEFDCRIDPAIVARYRASLADSHREVMTRLRHSMLAEFIRIDRPVCVSVVAQGTRFRRYASARSCWHFYVAEEPYPDKLLDGLDPEKYSTDSLFRFAIGLKLKSVLHEGFHSQTLQAGWRREPRPFGDRWLNEYLASMLGHFGVLVTTDMVNQQPATGSVGLIEDELYSTRVREACLSGAQAVRSLVGDSSSSRSMLGGSLAFWLVEDLNTDLNMMPFYWHSEFTALKAPGLGLEDVLARIPRCNPDRPVDAFALKQQLLDYDFQQLRAELPAEDIKPLPGLGEVWRQFAQHGLPDHDPFAACHAYGDSPAVQLACTGMVLDQLTLHPWRYRALAQRSLPLPESAQAYQARYEALLGDLAAWQGAGMPQADQPAAHYVLDQDGRYRNPDGHVADTAAAVNVWPSEDLPSCALQGEQQVQRLSGERTTLRRCRSDAELGAIWAAQQQSDRVVGIAALVRLQARLVADSEYRAHDEQVLPFVYQDGFPVFQLQHDATRLNVCLDTGSPVSYITRRYRERWGLTPEKLVALLEPERPDDTLLRRIRLPLLGQTALVRALPNSHYPQCDLIMGSDMAGLFSAVQLGGRELRLWRPRPEE